MSPITVSLHGAQLEGLELIISGLVPGVDAYELPGPQVNAPTLCIDSAKPISVGDEVQLCDSENTPLASVCVENFCPASGLKTWVSGPVRALRTPEHGPARNVRFVATDDLSTSTVAVFSTGVAPADVLRAIEKSGNTPLALIAEGVADRTASARLVTALLDVSEIVPDSRVFFVPHVDLGGFDNDATAAVLAGRGASDYFDFRLADPDPDAGAVLLFTGLSGSGKSTIARALTERLSTRSSRKAVLLDGDHVRHALASELGFSAADRHTNLLRQAWVGARVAEAGGIAICAPIAPFAASRAQMRKKVERPAQFFIVHVSTPLEVAEARDRKGLYAKARAGLISDFTGIDSPYEAPEDADLEIDTSKLSVEACVDLVVSLLSRHQVI